MADGTTPITLADVRSAATRLSGVAHRTPVLRSRTLDQLTGAQVYLKCENLQRVGAFKFRGAYNAISRLPPEQR
ncbi:MAG TPA: pyridoxal-phosphate dependent enzyme, partial [Jatrophihabitans sp.]|nr:pyridoxal-phosphate dependent enzyme [Jatrophihabitans sp.]